MVGRLDRGRVSAKRADLEAAAVALSGRRGLSGRAFPRRVLLRPARRDPRLRRRRGQRPARGAPRARRAGATATGRVYLRRQRGATSARPREALAAGMLFAQRRPLAGIDLPRARRAREHDACRCWTDFARAGLVSARQGAAAGARRWSSELGIVTPTLEQADQRPLRRQPAEIGAGAQLPPRRRRSC